MRFEFKEESRRFITTALEKIKTNFSISSYFSTRIERKLSGSKEIPRDENKI